MKVADAVRGPVRVVRADTPLPIVAAELAAQAGGAVPVVDTAGNPVGLLTAAGLAHAGEGRVEEINPEDVVAAVMTHRPATVGMDDPVVDVAAEVLGRDDAAVVVVDAGRVVGVLTRHALAALATGAGSGTRQDPSTA